MRPSLLLFIVLLFILIADGVLLIHSQRLQVQLESDLEIQRIAVAGLGLTDLGIATEARYTRHPAVSDPMAPFMDHPGALEHFPTGTFWAAAEQTNSRQTLKP